MEPDARSTGASTERERVMPRRAWQVLTVLGVLLVGLFTVRATLTSGAPDAICGNGQAEVGEECDDGNQNAEDGCLPGCRLATCGDGVKRAFVEDCDDGNHIDGDGCSSACVQCPESPTAFSSSNNGHCYWRENRRLTFDEATAACQFKKANLVIFSSDLEWKEVTERLLVGADLAPGPP
ncbi:MAG TPA: DUF4215 domain-containing protein, partial [Polyangia bacterium]